LVTENKPGGLQWILLPGNKLVYNARKSGASQAIAEVKTLVSYNADTLVFENETLEHICKTLEERYGATIRIQAASLKLKRLTLKQKDESLAQVMEMLSTAAGFSYNIQGNQVNITKAN
jgi:ferric-dicitrate binding protein FerR (iron transport regulator)